MATHLRSLQSAPALPSSTRPMAGSALVAVMLFQGVTATAGGTMMAAGSLATVNVPGTINPPDAWLDGLPFDTWLIPGLVLGIGLGISALVIGWGLIRRPAWPWLSPLERWTGRHWSWVASIILGAGLVAWIMIEITLIPLSWLQVAYGVLGASILVLATRPSVRTWLAPRH